MKGKKRRRHPGIPNEVRNIRDQLKHFYRVPDLLCFALPLGFARDRRASQKSSGMTIFIYIIVERENDAIPR